VRDGKCEACHAPHASTEPNLLVKPASSLCTSCHESIEALKKWPVVHAPLRTGSCTRCHDPHGSNVAMSLIDEPSVLCVKCHASAGLPAKHRGFPMEKADCSGCHAPHAAKRANLPHEHVHQPFGAGNCAACHAGTAIATKQPQPELCLSCHPGLAASLKEGKPHGAIVGEKACTACHAPHTGPVAPLLPARQAVVCATCHQAQVDANRTAAHRHPQVDGRDCTACHDPHLSPAEVDGKAAPEVCLNCHTYRDHVDHPMGEDTVDPRTGRKMTCNSCHDPHGSSFVRFLRDDPEGKLCIGCHTDKLRTGG
jgi:predicted CXXCH cytochrome family protein